MPPARNFKIEFDGATIACAIWRGPDNAAPPLLLIPGTMGFMDEMTPIIHAFATHFEVLTFDHPGMKGSSTMEHATPERLARALFQAVGQAFGDRPMSIYGVSLGAVVGALMARARPSRVRALVCDDPVFVPGTYAGIARYAADFAHDQPAGSPFLAMFRDFTGFDPATGEADGRSYLHLLPEVAAPVLLLSGTSADCALDAHAEAQLRAVHPGAQIERVDGGRHPIAAGAPEICAARTAGFAASAPAPPTVDPVRPDEFALRLADGSTAICVREITSTSTAVLLELEDWFEDEMAFVRTLVQPGWRAFDAGANIGVYSLALGTAGAEVAAYEPNPPIADRGRRALALNRLSGRVHHREAALGAAPGTAYFDSSGMPENAHLAATGTVAVRVTTFDDELASLGWDDIDFIKMDLEGGEVEALRGAGRMLSQHSPLLMTEIAKADGSPNFEPLHALAAAGYSIFSLIPGLSLLAPFDESKADPFQVYGFAAKPDRVAKLKAAGRLVERIPEPEPLSDPRPWVEMALQRVRTIAENPAFAAGLSRPQEPGGGDLVEAIARFERARGAGRAPELRLADLEASRRAAIRAYAARMSAPRALVLARVSRELGLRGAAAAPLGDMMRSMSTGGRLQPDEPMVPALARHESVRARSPGDWLVAAVAEGYSALCGFAAGFNLQGQEAGVWSFLEEVGLATPATERARQVQAMLSGRQTTPMPHRLLAGYGSMNRNPEIWRGG